MTGGCPLPKTHQNNFPLRGFIWFQKDAFSSYLFLLLRIVKGPVKIEIDILIKETKSDKIVIKVTKKGLFCATLLRAKSSDFLANRPILQLIRNIMWRRQVFLKK